MRRLAHVATILALALSLAAASAFLPAAAPALPVPAAFVPGVARAADDLEIETAARYVVDPDARRVRVVIDVSAVNGKPNAVTGPSITRYFYDGVNLGIQPEATRVRATQDGRPVRVAARERDGYRLLTLAFREPIYFQESASVRLTFDLPAGAPRSKSDVRVGKAFATFVAWAFGDRGTVRVEIPANFRVDLSGETMERGSGPAGMQAYAATTSDPLDWYALVNATDDRALTRDRLVLAGGDEVVIRAWPEDRPWRSRVRNLLSKGVPELVARTGLEWPVEGALDVSEVHSPLLEGYAGFYDAANDEITISEDLDDLTIVHEASHAWFNKSLFAERWITEGLADEYASRALAAIGRKRPNPDPVHRDAGAAFALTAWPPPAPIRDSEHDAREKYGYDAAWTLMRKIVNRVGEPGMRDVFAAAVARSTAYPGEDAPEQTQLPNDWRRFLDLVEAGGRAEGIDELVAAWALDEQARPLLPQRTAARLAYDALVNRGGSWAAPANVRTAMDAWRFGAATDAMDAATAVLGQRDEVASLARQEALVPPPDTEARYQDADSEGDLARIAEDLRASLAVLEGIVAAGDVVGAPRDWLTDLGLDGRDPASSLEAAQTAWEAGDLELARVGADAATGMLAAAPEAGRTRAFATGGVVAAVLIGLVVLTVVLASRRRPQPAPAPPAAPEWPYATLPPDGPPSEPTAAPSPPDEGVPRP